MGAISIEEYTLLSGESKNIEYKVTLPDKSEKYMKTIVAFANTQGGKLIVGVDDNSHQVIGVDNDILFEIKRKRKRNVYTCSGNIQTGLSCKNKGIRNIRNKGLANVFSQMGFVEAWGSGIKRILNAAKEYDLPEPKIQEFDNMFRVELFRKTPMMEEVGEEKGRETSEKHRRSIGDASEKHRRSVGETPEEHRRNIKETELNDTQRRIMEMLSKDNQLSAAKLAEKIGIARRNIEVNIKNLKIKGILVRHGSPKNGYWEVTEEYRNDTE